MILNFITWNANPEIVRIGSFAVRWYGLFFALAFYIGYLIFTRFFRKEGVEHALLDKLLIYMAIGTIVGARLGHCLFYEPEYYLSNPLEILKVWRGGLASHGAAIGILLALYLFARKTKNQFLWVMDRIVIVVALGGFFIRMGNLMNSEIYGIATHSRQGFVYIRDNQKNHDIIDHKKIHKIKIIADRDQKMISDVAVKSTLKIDFIKSLRDTLQIKRILTGPVKNYLEIPINANINSDEVQVNYNVLSSGNKFSYSLEKNNNYYSALIPVLVIPKHPTQIYEAGSYLLIFFLLLWLYYKNKGKLYGGFLFGTFLVTVFGARFIIEIIKENQVPFENQLPLNMGQLLSIPFILLGVVMLIYAFTKKKIM